MTETASETLSVVVEREMAHPPEKIWRALTEPQTVLAYSWDGMGLETIVTWTLTPTDTGTRLRMEQVGFKPDQQQAYRGATAGWPRFFANMEQVLARLD